MTLFLLFLYELSLDSRVGVTGQEQKAGGKEEAGGSEAAGALGGRGEEQEGQAGRLGEPVGHGVHAMLLGPRVTGEAAGTASLRSINKKRTNYQNRKHQKDQDVGLRNQPLVPGSLGGFPKDAALWGRPGPWPGQQATAKPSTFAS